MNDIEKIEEWQKSRDPGLFAELITRYNPLVMKFTNQYANTGVSKGAIKTKARAQMVKSLNTYDSSAGTQPITHMYNNLKKLNRMASESLVSGHIPESRSLKMATYKTSVDNLTDRYGREPNTDEIADELKWAKKEVVRMNSELTGETTASNAEFDFFGNSNQQKSKDMELVDYMYSDLNGKDKVIFEHSLGYGGKSMLNNKEIAKKLNTHEMDISRTKKRLAKKIKEYR